MTHKLSLLLMLQLVVGALASAWEEPVEPSLSPEPPDPARDQHLTAALAGLVQLPPAPRPGSGRERHVRRRRAQALAAECRLDVEKVYQALGRGESEQQIRARAVEVRRIAVEIPATLGEVYGWLDAGITEEQILLAVASNLSPHAVAAEARRASR